MSDPREAQRETDLHELFVARGELAAAFAAVPDAALQAKGASDEYAVSGIVVHLTATIDHYRPVLAGLIDTQFKSFAIAAQDPASRRRTRSAPRRGSAPASGMRPSPCSRPRTTTSPRRSWRSNRRTTRGRFRSATRPASRRTTRARPTSSAGSPITPASTCRTCGSGRAARPGARPSSAPAPARTRSRPRGSSPGRVRAPPGARAGCRPPGPAPR